jgi:uncharacterized lipoprotein YmbA
MYQVQWPGAAVGWNPRTDDLYIEVAVAIESPELANWLDVHLGRRLRAELRQTDVGADVDPTPSGSGVPLYTLTIHGLTGELPHAGAVHMAVEKALSEGAELTERKERAAATYQEVVRRSR